MNLNTIPGPGDPVTWGPVTSHPNDPRCGDDDSMVCTIDGNTVEVEFIVAAGEVEVVSIHIGDAEFDPYSFDRSTREDLCAQIRRVIA